MSDDHMAKLRLSLKEWKKEIEPRPELLKRGPILEFRKTALRDLQHSLACATMLREESADEGRAAAYLSIRAFEDFCVSQGVPRDVLGPVVELAEALEGAAQGHLMPILKRDVRPHRPTERTAKQFYDGQMAALVECCRAAPEGTKKLSVSMAAECAAVMAKNADVPVKYNAQQLKGIYKRAKEFSRNAGTKMTYEIMIKSDAITNSPRSLAHSILVSESVQKFQVNRKKKSRSRCREKYP